MANKISERRRQRLYHAEVTEARQECGSILSIFFLGHADGERRGAGSKLEGGIGKVVGETSLKGARPRRPPAGMLRGVEKKNALGGSVPLSLFWPSHMYSRPTRLASDDGTW